MPFDVERKGAMYGICVALMEAGNQPNKKYIKKFLKVIKRDITKALNKEEAKHLMKFNADGACMPIRMIRNDTKLDKSTRIKMMRSTCEGFRKALDIGLNDLYGK